MSSNDTYQMLINGRPVVTDRVLEVINPATGSVFATVARADGATVDQAVAAARQAFPGWAATPHSERMGMMRRIGEVLAAHADELGRLSTTEQGQPIADAVSQLAQGSMLAAYLADHVAFEPVVYPSRAGRYIVEHRKPLGVVAAITPWKVALDSLGRTRRRRQRRGLARFRRSSLCDRNNPSG